MHAAWWFQGTRFFLFIAAASLADAFTSSPPLLRTRTPTAALALQIAAREERQPPPRAVNPPASRPLPTKASAPSNRRSLLASLALLLAPAAAAAAGSKKPQGPSRAEEKALRDDLLALVDADRDLAPTLVRLSWHSSGTFDRATKTGGSGKGTIRFGEELAHGANAGLQGAVDKLEAVKAKHPTVSYADLYTLAGVVAIWSMGGPKVPWRGGRVDSQQSSDVTPDGRLPEPDKGSPEAMAAHLREVFGRMGFNDQEIVVLSGAHTIGFCRPESSGYDGKWTPSPRRFNNIYFKLLVNFRWDPKNMPSGKLQYGLQSGNLLMLPSDLVLLQDEGFKKWVLAYGEDEELFFIDFAKAFQKLEELGTDLS